MQNLIFKKRKIYPKKVWILQKKVLNYRNKFEIYRTRSPWATSLNWEISFIKSIHTLWFYQNVHLERTKTIIYFLIIELGFLLYLGSPSPKVALCQVWLKLAQSFLRRRFLNFVNVFSLFRTCLLLGKGRALFFEQTLIPITQGCFVPSFHEIGQVVLEKMKVWKVFGRTDDRWSEKLTCAFTSGVQKKIAVFM